MNTIRSTWIGWGALCAAGGGAYYFAKRAINSDRAARHEASQRRKEEAARIEARYGATKPPIPVPPTPRSNYPPVSPSSPPAMGPSAAGTTSAIRHSEISEAYAEGGIRSPSDEAGHDSAPTRHEPDTEAQRVEEKGKYEAAEAFRPRKGNRFS